MVCGFVLVASLFLTAAPPAPAPTPESQPSLEPTPAPSPDRPDAERARRLRVMAATELTYTHLRITDFESSSGALRQTVAGTSVSQSLVTSSEAIGISYLVLDGLEVGLALSVGSINAGGGVDVALGPSLSVFFDDHLYLGLEAAARALYFNDLTENPFDAIQQPGDGDHRLTAFPLVGLEVGLRVGFAIPLTRWLELAPEVRLQAMPLILAQNDVKVTFYSCPDGGTCAQGDTRSPASMLALGGTAALNVRAKF